MVKNHETAIAESGAVLRMAMWFGLAALGMAILQAPPLALILFVAALVTASGIVVWRFFCCVQVRLIEMLIVFAIFGNVMGWFIGQTGRQYFNVDRLLALLGCLLVTALWLFGGATTGLIIARHLRYETSGSRIGLMALFCLYPAAIAGLPLSVLYFLLTYDHFGRAWAFTCFFLSIAVVMAGYGFRRDALHAQRRMMAWK